MKTVFVVIPLLVLVTFAGAADEPAPAGPEAEKTAPDAKAPEKTAPEIKAKGTFLPVDAVAVIPKPEGWRGRYIVEFAVEPGTLVKEGDVVLRFDARAITEAVEEGRIEIAHAKREFEMGLRRAEFSAAAADRDMARKEREYAHALRRKQDWIDWDKPREAARAALDRRSQDYTVKNAEEELAQLEKMYEEDELVDDTEEIVLERSRWNLERRRKYRDWWVEARERTEKVTFPRRDDDREFDLANRKASIEKSREEYEMGKVSREISLERTKRAWAKRQRDHERLEYALTTMEIKAPCDGILLHGPIEGALSRAFQPGAQVNAMAAVVSIATPGDLLVSLSVPAKEILRVKTGLAVRIQPEAVGAVKIETTITYVSALPKGGKLVVRCALPEGTPAAMLGTSAAVRILLPEKAE
ncbi:MAG: HlyD family efflux transporter periplasmic adaptor subunit [Planctomycetota bacterium]